MGQRRYQADFVDKIFLMDHDQERERAARHRVNEAERRKSISKYMDSMGDLMTDERQGRKMDKLTILRLASDEIKLAKRQYSVAIPHETALDSEWFLVSSELKHLISKIEDGFLIIIRCDDTRVVHTSETIQTLLSYSTVSKLASVSIGVVLN